MSKRITAWGLPAAAFVVAATLAVLAGPSLGAMSRVRALQAATDFKPECIAGPLGGLQVGQSRASWLVSEAPIRYSNGQNMLFLPELSSAGFAGWTHSRALAGLYSDHLGYGWKLTGILQAAQNGGQINIIDGSTSIRSFQDNGDGTYTPLAWYQDTLVLDSLNHLLTLTDVEGNQWIFFDFTGLASGGPAGWLKEAKDRAGNVTSTVYGSSGVTLNKILEIEQSDPSTPTTFQRFVYEYNLSGAASGLLAAVTFQSSVGGVTTTVRKVEYSYYLTPGPNGPSRSIQWARISDGTTVFDTYYHRYDTTVFLPNLMLSPTSYERAKVALGGDSGIDGASEATLTPFADYTFQYGTPGSDGVPRVVQETAQGKGCGCGGSGGVGTYSFAQTNSTHGASPGPNVWSSKTTETLPDGNQNVVYTNQNGNAMVEVFKDVSSGTQWMTWHQYDSQSREIMTVMPSALTGVVNESDPALLSGSNFNDNQGLVHLYDFYSTTDLPNGAVAGYRSTHRVKQGEFGTPILMGQIRYTSHTDGAGNTVYPPASTTSYRNVDGTGAITVNYGYSWQGTTNRISERTTSYPAVDPGQNGSGSSTVSKEHFDEFGRLVWSMNEGGFITKLEYDPLTGANIRIIQDVDTSLVSDEPPGWVTPVGGGLQLETSREVDFLGRVTRETDAEGRITYTVYRDIQREVRIYLGWDSSLNAPTSPTIVSREERPSSYSEMLTMSAAPSVSGGRPDGTEVISGVRSLERTYFDNGDRLTHTDTYFNLTGLGYPSIGTEGTHFYRRNMNYDVRGRKDREADLTGTIRRTVFDSRGRAVSHWIGTDDTPLTGDWSPLNLTGTNLIQISGFQYDLGGVGDGNLTLERQFTSPTTSLDTVTAYDFQNRAIDSRGPDGIATHSTLDNLGRVIVRETYADANLDLVPASSEIRSRSEFSIDTRGHVYRSATFKVDPITGVLGSRLTKNYWHDARGILIKAQDSNGLFTKARYDGAGRETATFISYDVAETLFTDAFNVVGDAVVDQTVTTFDRSGKILQQTHYQRSSSAGVPSGDLSVGWDVSNSRRTFVASWYDLAYRLIAQVDYGTNGNVDLVRPSTPPAPNSSSNWLVTKYEYDAAGRQHRTTDNLGKISQTEFDDLARPVKTIRNYIDGVASENELDTDKVIENVYDSAGRISQRIAYNPKGTGLGVESQVTQYVYGTIANQSSPAVFRNDVIAAALLPDSDDTYNPLAAPGAQLSNGTDGVFDRMETTYDYASRISTTTDQRGVVHTMTYDTQGRLQSDAATTVPSGVDAFVRRIERTYDDLSRERTVSSYDAVSGGTLINQVKHTYDGWGNRIVCEQSHTDGVIVGTPSYQTTYADGAVLGEAKYVRPSSYTYPNGRGVNVDYPGAIDDKLSRVGRLSHSTGSPIYAEHTYLGTGSVVKVTHPQVTGGFTLDYGAGTGSPAGWDRFGRIITQQWGSTADPQKFERRDYTYNNMSQRLTSDMTYTGAPTIRDEQYTYDNLHRLKTMKRGTLASGTISDAASKLQFDWNELDVMGNWRTWRTDPNGGVPAWKTQGRAHNKANEIDVDNNDANAAGASITQLTGTGMNWLDPTYDKAGNLASAPRPSAETAAASRLLLTYDAWNRLVIAKKNSGVTLAEYQYDGSHQRIVKLIPNGTKWDRTDYYYNLSGQVLEERTITAVVGKTTAATVPKMQWVWDLRYIDAPILRDENKDGDGDCIDGTDERLYFAQDANFNTITLVSTAGTVIERNAYDPYGEPGFFSMAWASHGQTAHDNEILFAGYRFDPETELYHVRRRAYHPTLGRFLQRDPAGYHDGMNLYQYVGSAPTMLTDPSGMWRIRPLPEFFRIHPGDRWANTSHLKLPWNAWFTWNKPWMNGIFAPPTCSGGAGFGSQMVQALTPKELIMMDQEDPAINARSGAAVNRWWSANPNTRYWQPFNSNNDLIDRDTDDRDPIYRGLLIMAGPNAVNNCMDKLEVLAHGAPTQFIRGAMGKITLDIAFFVGLRWGTTSPVKWCATPQVFLSGCNTGIDNARVAGEPQPAEVQGPLARRVAGGFGTGKIYGPRGYVRSGGIGFEFPATYLAAPGSFQTKAAPEGHPHFKDGVSANGIQGFMQFKSKIADTTPGTVGTDP